MPELWAKAMTLMHLFVLGLPGNFSGDFRRGDRGPPPGDDGFYRGGSRGREDYGGSRGRGGGGYRDRGGFDRERTGRPDDFKEPDPGELHDRTIWVLFCFYKPQCLKSQIYFIIPSCIYHQQ